MAANPVQDALLAKIQAMKAKHSMGPMDKDEQLDQDRADDDVAGPAPHLRGDDLEHPASPEGHLEDESQNESLENGGKPPKLTESFGHENSEEMGLKDGDPMHIAILKGLSDHGHNGRGSSGLHERAADKAKEKMSSIEKHKKGKGLLK